MELSVLCNFCQKSAPQSKGHLSCGICKGAVCKQCIETVSEDFSFLKEVPEHLTHGSYCPTCYDKEVVTELTNYKQMMARARQVAVYFKKQSKETRTFRRKEKAIEVTNCDDRDETILRLAFIAAQSNFSTLVDVDVSATKVRNAGYQTSRWQGIGIAVNQNR